MDSYDILLMGEGSSLFLTLSWALGYKGYRIKSAAKPEEALEALVKKNFDLIIARLNQKDMDILGVLKRAKILNPALKVMVVNGLHQAFPREAYEMDLDDYLVMPLTPVELLRRIRRCLGQDASERLIDQTPATEINDRVLHALKCVFWDIRGSITAALENLRLYEDKLGEVEEAAAHRMQEATTHLARVVDLSEEFLTGILAPRAAEPEILDLVNLAEPPDNQALPGVRPQTRRTSKKAEARKGELFEMPVQKQACNLCSTARNMGSRPR